MNLNDVESQHLTNYKVRLPRLMLRKATLTICSVQELLVNAQRRLPEVGSYGPKIGFEFDDVPLGRGELTNCTTKSVQRLWLGGRGRREQYLNTSEHHQCREQGQHFQGRPPCRLTGSQFLSHSLISFQSKAGFDAGSSSSTSSFGG